MFVLLFCVKSRAAFIVFTVASCLMGFISLFAHTDTRWIVMGVLLAIVTLAVIITVAIIVAKRSSSEALLVLPSATQVTCQRKSENSSCCFGWFTVCFKPVIAVACLQETALVVHHSFSRGHLHSSCNAQKHGAFAQFQLQLPGEQGQRVHRAREQRSGDG